MQTSNDHRFHDCALLASNRKTSPTVDGRGSGMKQTPKPITTIKHIDISTSKENSSQSFCPSQSRDQGLFTCSAQKIGESTWSICSSFSSLVNETKSPANTQKMKHTSDTENIDNCVESPFQLATHCHHCSFDWGNNVSCTLHHHFTGTPKCSSEPLPLKNE